MAVVIPERRMLIIPTQNPARYDTIPVKEVREVDKGIYAVALPFTYETLILLKNIGIEPDAPTPFDLYSPELLVRGLYKMRDYQKVTTDFICRNKHAYVLHAPRTGKTNSALAAINFLKQESNYPCGKHAALVVGPLSLLRDAWIPEAPRFTPNLKVNFLIGSKNKRLNLLDEAADIYVINCDGIKIIQDELFAAVKSGKISTIILDELTEYKNHRTKRFMAMQPIVRAADRVIGMTGTAGSAEDVYGEILMVTPERLRANTHVITKRMWLDMTTIEVGMYRRVPKPSAKQLIHEYMQPAIRFEKKDILDMPVIMEDYFTSEMTSEQLKAYNIMKNDSVVGLENGTITAVNAGVQIQKLLQIASGNVITDSEVNNSAVVKELNISTHIENLRLLISESETKVVIYSSWTATINRLVNELNKIGIKAVKYDGSVSAQKRQETLEHWRNSSDCKVIVMHPVTGAYGIELAAADTLIFFGVPRNGKIIFDQARERLMSPQQKSLTPRIVKMILSPADNVAFKSLMDKTNDAKSNMDLFKEIVDA